MKLLEPLRTDGRAVSPVLGVALLIAITVILAGVVGFVVLGVDTQGANAPQAQLDFNQQGADVALVHDGGDRINNSSVTYSYTGSGTLDASGVGSTVATGDEYTIVTGASAGEKIKVIWKDPSSDREVLLAEYTVEAP